MCKPKKFPDTAVLVSPKKLQELLTAGANVHELDKKGRTALFRVCRVGQVDKAEILISAGADPNFIDKQGEAPLQSAARYGNLDCIRVLLKAGANIDHCPPASLTDFSESALYSATRKCPEAARMLLEAGANPNKVTESKKYPLLAAIRLGKTELVHLMISHNARLDISDRHGNTPLHRAVESQNLDLVKLLLEVGVDSNAGNERGETPLFAAISHGKCSIAVLNLLLAAKPNLLARDSIFKETALERAIRVGQQETLKLLSEAGSPIPQVDEELDEDEIKVSEEDSKATPVVTPEDEKLASQAGEIESSLVASLGWKASPRHWAMLEGANNYLGITRMAYFARGRWNLPAGRELEDGPAVLGENYRTALDRFTKEGLVERASEAREIELVYGVEELKRVLKGHGLQTTGKKSDLAARLHASLPAEIFRERLEKVGGYYRLTENGQRMLNSRDSQIFGYVSQLRAEILGAIRSENLKQAVSLARALHLILIYPSHSKNLPQPIDIANSRFLVGCAFPDGLNVFAGSEARLRIILAAEALCENLSATWETWDAEINPPTTMDGKPVSLKDLELCILSSFSFLDTDEGCLCPALFKYFDKTSKELYGRAEAKT